MFITSMHSWNSQATCTPTPKTAQTTLPLEHTLYSRDSLNASQISHLLVYPSLRQLVPGLSSPFCNRFLYNLFLRSAASALVSNIFGKWLQDFVSFGNPFTGYKLTSTVTSKVLSSSDMFSDN